MEIRLHRVARGRLGPAHHGVPEGRAGASDRAQGRLRDAAVQGQPRHRRLHLLLPIRPPLQPTDGADVPRHRQRDPYLHVRKEPPGPGVPVHAGRPQHGRRAPLQDRGVQGVAALPGGPGPAVGPVGGADGADHQVQQGHPLLQVHHQRPAQRPVQDDAAHRLQARTDHHAGHQPGAAQPRLVRRHPGPRRHVRQDARAGPDVPHVLLQGGGHVCDVVHEDVHHGAHGRGAH
mmetsp:Transcript_46578/g.97466  ORF Transcript_46578/g.97466 Transcript_46578/m.97466 type:complete len:232 (-) Transcript_46578:398-1093(-)